MPLLIFIDGNGTSRVFDVPEGIQNMDFLTEEELPEDYGNLILTQLGWESLVEQTERAIGSVVNILV